MIQRLIRTDDVLLVHRALNACGVPAEAVDPRFIRYHLRDGKTPNEIAAIATNTKFQLPRRES